MDNEKKIEVLQSIHTTLSSAGFAREPRFMDEQYIKYVLKNFTDQNPLTTKDVIYFCQQVKQFMYDAINSSKHPKDQDLRALSMSILDYIPVKNNKQDNAIDPQAYSTMAAVMRIQQKVCHRIFALPNK